MSRRVSKGRRHSATSLRKKLTKNHKGSVGVILFEILLFLCFVCWVCYMDGKSLNHAKEAKEFMKDVIFPIIYNMSVWIGEGLLFLASVLIKKINLSDGVLYNIRATIIYFAKFTGIFLLLLGVSTLVLYAKTETAIANYEYTDTASAGGKDETDHEVEPARNDVEFKWEDDPYVVDVNQYFTGTIKKEEKEEYILILLQEYLEESLEIPEGYFDYNGDYDEFVGWANEYDDLQEIAINANYEPKVQETLQQAELACRMQADLAHKNSENRMLMGNTENELAKLGGELQIENWQEHYDFSLVYYIKGLTCAIKEEQERIYVAQEDDGEESSVDKNWEYIKKTYKIVNELEDSNANSDGAAEVMLEVCGKIEIKEYMNESRY